MLKSFLCLIVDLEPIIFERLNTMIMKYLRDHGIILTMIRKDGTQLGIATFISADVGNIGAETYYRTNVQSKLDEAVVSDTSTL